MEREAINQHTYAHAYDRATHQRNSRYHSGREG
jgi:hypothetical protein